MYEIRLKGHLDDRHNESDREHPIWLARRSTPPRDRTTHPQGYGKQYDLILATNGYHPLADYQRALSPAGRYVTTGGASAQMTEAMLYGPLKSRNGKQHMGNLLARPNQKDLEYVAELLGAGTVKPVIARRYSLVETADAIRFMEAGRAHGKIVITV